MKACRQTGRLIELQFEGELSWKQELRLQDHLADCPECAALSRAQRQVLESLGSYREAPLAKIDVQRFVEKVQDSISDKPVGEAPPEALQPTRSFKPFALAATVLLALGLPWVLNRTDKPSEGEPNSTTERLAEITPELQPDPVGELVQAPRPIDHDSDFQAERHQAAVADLRGALSALMGESPDWKLYGDRVEALRTAGWPMASLISGLLGDEHLETAKAAIQALASEGGRLAHRRLWDLRRDERLGSFAVEELQVRGVLTMAQAVDLYWEGQFEAIALDGLAECNGAQALQGAKRLMRKAPRRKIPDDSIPVLAGLLQRAGDAGSMHALALLEDRNLSQELWAAEVARSLDLREVLEMYLACGDGSAWENGALALASQHTSAVWVPFLEECCNRSRTANRAVRALQGQPGLAALDLLLAQESNRMVNEDVWLAAWNKAVELDGSRLVGIAESFRGGGSRTELEHFADVLLLGGQQGSGAALVEVASARDLSERLRCSLVLQIGNLNEAGTAYGLETLFSQLDRHDSELAACLVIALSRMLDAEQVADLLARDTRASEEFIQQIIALCDTQSRRSARERRYLIARKLKKVLGRRNLSSLE